MGQRTVPVKEHGFVMLFHAYIISYLPEKSTSGKNGK